MIQQLVLAAPSLLLVLLRVYHALGAKNKCMGYRSRDTTS